MEIKIRCKDDSMFLSDEGLDGTRLLAVGFGGLAVEVSIDELWGALAAFDCKHSRATIGDNEPD